MFIWNRVEVLVTLSLDYYMQARYVLQQNGIRNQSRKVQIEKHGWKRNADGMLRRHATEYHLYVHRDDVAEAQALLQDIGPETALFEPPTLQETPLRKKKKTTEKTIEQADGKTDSIQG